MGCSSIAGTETTLAITGVPRLAGTFETAIAGLPRFAGAFETTLTGLPSFTAEFEIALAGLPLFRGAFFDTLFTVVTLFLVLGIDSSSVIIVIAYSRAALRISACSGTAGLAN